MSGPEMAGSVHGSFHVVPNERIVQTFSPDGFPDLARAPHLRGPRRRRTRLTAQSLVESYEHRDAFLDAELADGWTRLDALFATL